MLVAVAWNCRPFGFLMPLTDAAVDRILLDVLKAVHNEGARLYNAGDTAAAARVYQGALAVAAAFLGHHPEVQQAVLDGLNQVARVNVNPAVRAFRLHEVFDQVRDSLKKLELPVEGPATDKLPGMAAAPLYGRVVAGDKPGAGLIVLFNVPGDPVTSASAAADPDGVFTVNVLPAEYVVTLSGPGVPADAVYQLTHPAGGGQVVIDLTRPGRLTVDDL